MSHKNFFMVSNKISDNFSGFSLGRKESRIKSRGRNRPSTRFTADGNADHTRVFSDCQRNAKRGHIPRIGVSLYD